MKCHYLENTTENFSFQYQKFTWLPCTPLKMTRHCGCGIAFQWHKRKARTRKLKQSIIIIFFSIRSPAYCFLLAWLTNWAWRSLLLIYICPGLKIKQYCSYCNFFQTKLSSTMIYYHSPYRMFLGADCFLQCLAETSLVFSSMQNMHLLISLLNSENNFDP